jgi:phage terminase small subunit
MAMMNPQRLLFKEYYCNPESETFGNARQSAIKAGFGEHYADRIMSPEQGNEWVKEIIRDTQMLSKAEKVLGECLEMNTTRVVSVGDEDDEDVQIEQVDPQLVRIKQDTAKFVSSRLGKEKWSERTEFTGRGGGPMSIVQITDEDFAKVISTYAGGIEPTGKNINIETEGIPE